ncbi:MAG: hypothetical protein RR049_02910 [Angelakisella sp.]
MSMGKNRKTPAPPTAGASAMTAVKEKSFRALRAVLWRRHIIVGCLAACVAVLLLAVLIPLIPRTVKPTAYRAGDMELRSITDVVGYRKLLGMSESLSGLGRAEAGEYTYKAGKAPKKDIEKYVKVLTEEYGASVAEGASLGETSGSLAVSVPTGADTIQVKLEISYDGDKYLLRVDEKEIPPPKPEKVVPIISVDEAKNIMLTLTKKETGFKSDISVYTTELSNETVNYEGWDYYVFTVLADYSATRIEYRGTFYVSCHDGAILRYDKETGTASRIVRDEPAAK